MDVRQRDNLGLVEEVHGAVVHRSSRRRKTIQARIQDGRLHVFVPDNLSPRKEREAVEEMRQRLEKAETKKRARSEVDLESRARSLMRRWFGFDLRWREISFMPPSSSRYGWCDTRRRVIRISAELIDHPRWVLDYVIVHELAHLVVPNHGDEFWQIVRRYPKAERARGYLEGHSAALARTPAESMGECDEVPPPPINQPGRVRRRARIHEGQGRLELSLLTTTGQPAPGA